MVKLCVDGGACADLTRNQFDAATASSRAPWYLTRRNRARADLHRRQVADAARRHAKAKHKAAK